jgi:hypothetical protein
MLLLFFTFQSLPEVAKNEECDTEAEEGYQTTAKVDVPHYQHSLRMLCSLKENRNSHVRLAMVSVFSHE